MNTLLSIATRNNVLLTMAELLDIEREAIISINKKDLDAYKGDDISMLDRLKVDDAKVAVARVVGARIAAAAQVVIRVTRAQKTSANSSNPCSIKLGCGILKQTQME